jgi:dienelactone hydrolase
MKTATRIATRIAAVAWLLALLPLAAHAQPAAIPFDLGETIIYQRWFSPESRFYNMPVTLRGVLAVPDGEGPFPVALFLHGAYPFCTAPLVNEADVYPCPPEHDVRQYEGFAYLAQALAARGYLALIPDIGAEYTVGFGEPVFAERGVQIIEAHLAALAKGEGYGAAVASRADFSRLVIASHSRGGSLSVIYALSEARTHDVDALALVTPAFVVEEAIIPEDMPAALVISECDGDVQTVEPLVFASQLDPLRPAPYTIYTLPRGTHNAFSTRLGPDFMPPCDPATLLDPQLQRDFLAGFLPDFFDMALADYFIPASTSGG